MCSIIKTKLRAIGSATGLVLSEEVLADMALAQDDEVFLVKTEGGYRIMRYDPEFEAQVEAAEKGMGQYRNALKELAGTP